MKRWRESAWLVVALPSLAVVVALFFVPFLRSAVTSFTDKAGNWTLQNYSTVWRLYAEDILFTIFVSAVSLVIVLIIAVLVSGFIRIYGGGLVEFLFKIPLFVPFVVVGHAMRVFLAPHGLLNSALAQVGLVNLDDPETHNPEIIRTLVGAGVDIQFVGELRHSLEDVYLHLVKDA